MSRLTVIGADAEIVNLHNFLNSVLYGDKVNSIAEWMLSPEWTTAPTDTDERGSVTYAGTTTPQGCRWVDGEFEASPCGCHKPDGTAR